MTKTNQLFSPSIQRHCQPHCRFVLFQTPALEIAFSHNATLRYRDKYTGAIQYLSIYEPTISPAGFQFLGA